MFKKIIFRLSCLILILCATAVTQSGNALIVLYPGVPSLSGNGTCPKIGIGLNTSSGHFYSCATGTAWVDTGGTSGTFPVTKTAVANQPLLSYDSTTGLFTQGTIAYSGLTGLPQLPVTKALVANQFFTSYDSTTGLYTSAFVVATPAGFAIGTNGGTAGVLTLNGSTSGSATLDPGATAAAVILNKSFTIGVAGSGLNGAWSLVATSGGTPITCTATATSAMSCNGAWSGLTSLVVGSYFSTATTGSYQFTTQGGLFASGNGIFKLMNTGSTDFTRLSIGPDTTSFPALCHTGTTLNIRLGSACTTDAPISASNLSASGVLAVSGAGNSTISGAGGLTVANGPTAVLRLDTTGNCTSTSCGSSSAGLVTIAAGSTTVTVSTTSVGLNSNIQIQDDSGLGAALGVTCNTTFTSGPTKVTAHVASTSFTIAVGVAPVTNPLCLSWRFTNQ